MQGYRKTLQYEDIFDTPDALKTKKVYPKFHAKFNELVEDAKSNRGEKVRRS